MSMKFRLFAVFLESLDSIKTINSAETAQRWVWMLKGCVIQRAGAFALIPSSRSRCLCSYSLLWLGLSPVSCMCPDGTFLKALAPILSLSAIIFI